MTRRLWLMALAAMAAGCRGEDPRAPQTRGDLALARLVDSLRAPVEQATGLRFTEPPRSAMRSREQVRAYLIAKLPAVLPHRSSACQVAGRIYLLRGPWVILVS
jgi:hypothetical protein